MSETVYSPFRRMVRTGAILGACISMSSCIGTEEEMAAAPDAFEVGIEAIPTASAATVETTLPAETPVCEPVDGPIISGNFYEDSISVDNDFLEVDAIGRQINRESPDASPTEFANLFLSKATKKSNKDLEVILDPTLGLEDWGKNKEELQASLLWAMDDITSVLSRFPDGFFKALNVSKLRIADRYDQYAGHYNPSDDEFLFEYDGVEVNKKGLYVFMTHELGHAYHDRYCDGVTGNDPELSSHNSVEYMGYAGDGASSDEITAHNAQISPELFSYGPNREFAGVYGASSSLEDFATIIESMFTSRGLIKPGDADFGSPYHKKQRLVLSRLEAMLPGISRFLEDQTLALRLNVNNEVYAGEIPEVDIPTSLLSEVLNSTYENEQLAIMGVLPSPDERNFPQLEVTPFPIIRYDSEGNIEVERSRDEIFSSAFTLNPNAELRGSGYTLLAFVPKSAFENGIYAGSVLARLPLGVVRENWEFSLDTSSSKGIAALQDLQIEDFRPVKLKIEVD